MGVMNKLMDVMKLGDADAAYYNEEDDYGFEEDEEEEVVPVSKSSSVVVNNDYENTYETKVQKNQVKSNQKVTQMRQVKRTPGNMEVCVIKPTGVDDCREITDTLLGDRTVVLNMEGLDVDIAQRIIDYASGSTYAIKGNLQKISNYIFIITPPSVDISGDFQEIFSGTYDVPSVSHTL